MIAMNILMTQAAIVEEFEAFESWEERYQHIIAIGRQLPELAEEHRVDANKVRGCSSTVWLHAWLENGRIRYVADSDAVIVRGLVALLLRVYDQHKPTEILAADPAFIEELGLNQNLSSNRANGLAAMVKQVKAYALAFSHQDGA